MNAGKRNETLMQAIDVLKKDSRKQGKNIGIELTRVRGVTVQQTPLEPLISRSMTLRSLRGHGEPCNSALTPDASIRSSPAASRQMCGSPSMIMRLNMLLYIHFHGGFVVEAHDLAMHACAAR